MIRIDISMDAVAKLEEMLQGADSDTVGARIFCVPG